MNIDPLVFTAPDIPHTITLSAWNGDCDGEDFGSWDDCDITCPHQPATATMPCTMWEPCGCLEVPADMTEYDGGIGDGRGPCPHSPIGRHHYIEGEPNQPVAQCFAHDWDAEISQRAFNLGLPAGTYLVRPWWDGDTIQLELIDPLIAVTP